MGKKVKEQEAEKLVKAAKKRALAAEQQEKEKKSKEETTKEKKKKAECAAKQELEQQQIRFTLAQDKSVTLGKGWQNFGNSYEGLRLQKQGNVCMLSGLIREGYNKIFDGEDKGKQFWHAEMESLIETGEGSTQTADGTWGELATTSVQCRPDTEIELLANNHAEPAKIVIDKEGSVRWKSGGSRYGWVSLSGVAWKAGGRMDGSIRNGGTSIASITQGKVVFANGWKGEGVAVYKQGSMCFVLGTAYGGRNFNGRLFTLDPKCRPKRKMMFPMSRGKQSFRLDVSSDGAVTAAKVPDGIDKHIDLQSIVFSVQEGEEIKLHHTRNWRTSEKYPKPHAVRQGALCVLSGVAFNGDIRAGTHSLLKNSGSPGTLPEWCLPRHRMAFSTVQLDGKIARIDVLPSGEIRWIAGARSQYLNLVGIKFDVRADIVQKFSESLLKVSKCE